MVLRMYQQIVLFNDESSAISNVKNGVVGGLHGACCGPIGSDFSLSSQAGKQMLYQQMVLSPQAKARTLRAKGEKEKRDGKEVTIESEKHAGRERERVRVGAGDKDQINAKRKLTRQP